MDLQAGVVVIEAGQVHAQAVFEPVGLGAGLVAPDGLRRELQSRQRAGRVVEAAALEALGRRGVEQHVVGGLEVQPDLWCERVVAGTGRRGEGDPDQRASGR